MAEELLRLVVVGSVDDGKSTLIGRLLYECGGLFEDQIAAVQQASRGDGLDFSLFTDGLKAEREQGITIDVAYRYFSTTSRKVIIADTPGHVQYTRNMATGASTADAAVVLLDARLGVLPQTRRHAYIASLLGIPWLAVAINKMDAVGFDRQCFERLSGEVEQIARAMGFEDVRSFPVSARDGDNVTTRSARMPWHEGPSLLQWLDALPGHHRRAEPFRFPVQLVQRVGQDYRGFAGQIASGSVTVGDAVVVLPSGCSTEVVGIDTFDGPLSTACAPRSVTLRLRDEVDVGRGDLLAPRDDAPQAARRWDAMLVWFSDTPLRLGQKFVLKHTTRSTSATVQHIAWKKDLERLTEVPAEVLEPNDVGRVTLECKRPLVADAYVKNRHTGAFILIDPGSNDTVAAGMVLGPTRGEEENRSLVPPAARQQRMGHRGAVLLLTPDTTNGELYVLERDLFTQGMNAVAVAGDVDVALALGEAGLLAVLLARGAQHHSAVRNQLMSAGVEWREASKSQALEAAQRMLATD